MLNRLYLKARFFKQKGPIKVQRYTSISCIEATDDRLRGPELINNFCHQQECLFYSYRNNLMYVDPRTILGCKYCS